MYSISTRLFTLLPRGQHFALKHPDQVSKSALRVLIFRWFFKLTASFLNGGQIMYCSAYQLFVFAGHHDNKREDFEFLSLLVSSPLIRLSVTSANKASRYYWHLDFFFRGDLKTPFSGLGWELRKKSFAIIIITISIKLLSIILSFHMLDIKARLRNIPNESFNPIQR